MNWQNNLVDSVQKWEGVPPRWVLAVKMSFNRFFVEDAEINSAWHGVYFVLSFRTCFGIFGPKRVFCFCRGCWNKFNMTEGVLCFVIPNLFRNLRSKESVIIFCRGCWNKFSMTERVLSFVIPSRSFWIGIFGPMKVYYYCRRCWNKFSMTGLAK